MGEPARLPGRSDSVTIRTSQRPSTACRECSRRKVRCDKKIPCSRCVRLSKPCSREIVRVGKALSTHRDELSFLHGLHSQLSSGGASPEVSRVVERRISSLELGHLSPASDHHDTQGIQPASPIMSHPERAELRSAGELRDTEYSVSSDSLAIQTNIPVFDSNATPDRRSARTTAEQKQSENAAAVWTVESLAWGRNKGACYPHRRCICRAYRKYPEMASINCDLDDPSLVWTPVDLDLTVFPPEADARTIMAFHMEHLWWHHSAFHGPTFLKQCEIFWQSGTVVHPLWTALYLGIIAATIWTLLNSDNYRNELVLSFDESIVQHQYRAMLNILYRENYLENSSMFTVQAIAISTRVAHSLGMSDTNAKLLSSAVGVAQSLGLHRIQLRESPLASSSTAGLPKDAWTEAIEIEVGKRSWWQLIVQDYFSIPFTETFLINRSHCTTPIHMNCNDSDLLEREDDIPTSSSYVRIVAREALLMPRLLDGMGQAGGRKSWGETYDNVLRSDQEMRNLMRRVPPFLVRDNTYLSCNSWLPAARRTLAISAADKVIMIHRPILYQSFQDSRYSRTRATCIAAATTILREHEQATHEQTVLIWTQSAFCITAAMVLGLELLHRTSHTDEKSSEYREMLTKAAHRLRERKSDILAKRAARLIETFLSFEEELVVRVMRKRGASPDEKQRQVVNDMISRNELLAKFLDVDFKQSAFASPQPLLDPHPDTETELGYMGTQGFDDFDAWFNDVFEPVYNVPLG